MKKINLGNTGPNISIKSIEDFENNINNKSILNKNILLDKYGHQIDLDIYKELNKNEKYELYVNINGKLFKLSEISNIIVGFNASILGINDIILATGAMSSVIFNDLLKGSNGNGITGEVLDQWLYAAGKGLAEYILNNGGDLKKINKEILLKYMIEI